jgi:hypothetical protein
MRLVSWDGHNINDGTYESSLEVGMHTPPGVVPGIVEREDGALAGGATTPARYGVIRTVIPTTGDKRALQAQWYRWFRPQARRIAAVVVEDDDGSNERFVYAMALDVTHDPEGDGWELLTTVVVHDEMLWQSVVEESAAWAITGSGQTTVVTNGSAARNEDAYPTYTATPNADKSSNQIRGVFVPVRWPSDQAAVSYPYDLGNGAFNTAALVGAGKMQADGDDLRVTVDGVGVRRWLSGINTSATKVWVGLDFQPKREFTLAAARSSGSTSSIVVGEDITGMPGVGLLQIDSEVFSYTSVDVVGRAFKGVTPAAKNTTAASHSAAATVIWIQHDIMITYGDALAPSAPATTEGRPVFDLASSTNTSWVYQEFFEEGVERPGAWGFAATQRTEGYGGNQDSTANPFVEMGVASTVAGATKPFGGAWILYHPCGISAANFTNGQMYQGGSLTTWSTGIRSSVDGSSYVTRYSIPKPTAASTWQSWSQNVTGLPSGTRYVALWHEGSATLNRVRKVEVADVTVTLDSSKTPTSSIGSEASAYQLRARLANLTTGEALDIDFDMALGSSLEIDTDTLRVTYLADGSRQYQAITPDAPRDAMLRLAPGANTLEWTDAGTTDVTVGVVWRKRWIN